VRLRPATIGLLVPLALTAGGIGVATASHSPRQPPFRDGGLRRRPPDARRDHPAAAPTLTAHRPVRTHPPRRVHHPVRLSSSAHSFPGLPAIGAIFSGPAGRAVHTCTGAVVHSPGGDLVLTAAHCVVGTGTGLTFVPDYHDGRAPYGSWPVQQVYVTRGWRTSGDPRQDFAFLLVSPQVRAGRAVNLESIVGSYRLVTDPADRLVARVVGYPDLYERPITCTNRTYDRDGFLGFDCAGYPDGTSGGPFLVDPDGSGRDDEVVGLIGGLHEGGCTLSTSYSAYFGPAIARLYRRALTGGVGDTVPPPPGSRCG
jgi:hypothetical protein